MRCRICGIEMNKGTIEADNRLCWIPENETVTGITKWSKSPNSIILAEWFFLIPAKIIAFHCENCKTIIIDLNKENQ